MKAGERVVEGWNVFKYLWQCYKAYRMARAQDLKVVYFSVSRYGVPSTSVLVAHGRSAWAVSDLATRYFGESQGG